MTIQRNTITAPCFRQQTTQSRRFDRNVDGGDEAAGEKKLHAGGEVAHRRCRRFAHNTDAATGLWGVTLMRSANQFNNARRRGTNAQGKDGA